ncbi:MAG: BamA/TamA family outer membrane protein [Balneolaceae bacterium]
MAKISRGFLTFLFICSFCISQVHSQTRLQIPTSEENVTYAVLPILGFTSDLGFIGGARGQRFDYGDNPDLPFKNVTQLDLSASTKGSFNLLLDHTRLRSFGTDIRSRFIIDGLIFQNTPFFGIGNNSPFSSNDFNDDLNFFEFRRFLIQHEGRKHILPIGNEGFLDVMTNIRISTTDPRSRGDETVFSNNRPFGADGGWVNRLGFGLVADTRDNEFDTRKGVLAEALISFSGDLTASDFSFTKFLLDFRQYRNLIADITIAQRIELHHVSGSAPFWERPTLGSFMSLRGFVEGRFIGDTSIQQNLELRTWVFSIFDDEIRLGAQAFWDSGRVFSRFDSDKIFKDWNHTFGVGGVFSIFTPDFIVRGDIGISNEIIRVYGGLGYAF